jgi:hypothetical protein
VEDKKKHFEILDDSESDIEPSARSKREVGTRLCIQGLRFLRPMPYYAAEEVIQQNHVVFPKQYVKDIIKMRKHLEYRRKKKTFELNKMGRLNLHQLKEVNEKNRNKAQLKLETIQRDVEIRLMYDS